MRHEQLELTYRRIGPSLYRQALSILADPAEAEDVVQEAFARVVDREVDGGRSLDGYLARTVRNLSLNSVRRTRIATKGRGRAARRRLTEPHSPADQELAVIASGALKDLPVEQREVVILRVFDGLSFPDIAERTEVPLGTVHSRFRYAMGRLRMALESKS